MPDFHSTHRIRKLPKPEYGAGGSRERKEATKWKLQQFIDWRTCPATRHKYDISGIFIIVVKRFSWLRFRICDARYDACTLPASWRLNLAPRNVFLLRLDANAFRRMHSKWVFRAALNYRQLISFLFTVIATVALAFLLLPMCQYIIRPCTDGHRMSLGCCGRFTAAELLSFTMSITVVCIWVLTGHWLLMDAMVS